MTWLTTGTTNMVNHLPIDGVMGQDRRPKPMSMQPPAGGSVTSGSRRGCQNRFQVPFRAIVVPFEMRVYNLIVALRCDTQLSCLHARPAIRCSEYIRKPHILPDSAPYDRVLVIFNEATTLRFATAKTKYEHSNTAATRSLASHIFPVRPARPARPAAESMAPKRNSNLPYFARGDFRMLGLRTTHSNWPKHVHRNRLRLSLQPQWHRTMRSRTMDAYILQGPGDISTTSHPDTR